MENLIYKTPKTPTITKINKIDPTMHIWSSKSQKTMIIPHCRHHLFVLKTTEVAPLIGKPFGVILVNVIVT